MPDSPMRDDTTGRASRDGNTAIRDTSVAVVAGLALAAILAGFIGLPMLQAQAGFQGVWDAICAAAGVPSGPPAAANAAAPLDERATRVVVTPQMMGEPGAQSIGQGATLALRCTMCHGARGLSEANSPNLAGQYAPAVYKQLLDYKSGVRPNAVMAPLVAGLSDRDMRDLAAYYAYLPRFPAWHPATSTPPRIVSGGDPMRGIAPCASCHGGVDNKAGSAWLDGQPVAYLRTQLQAFASGERRNDISAQMRNVARRMTPAEIEAAVVYYAGQPEGR